MLLTSFRHSALKLKSITSVPLENIFIKSTYSVNTQKRIAPTNTQQEPILKLPQGLIKGLKRKTIYDHDYYSFEGIPYAVPPIGELRFKAPVAASGWSDVRDCREFNKRPLQRNRKGSVTGTEDCLYVNVFAKTLQAEEKLPVMVWFYGGAFNTGSAVKALYSPDYFMQENIILVTFNYRLSSLGFLSFADPACEVPGNAGLKDQVLVLKWVKENIPYFGGDNENITIFGQSSGGVSVHYMTLCEQTAGLFHKAICMSGVAHHPWSYNENATHWPYRLATMKGYTGPNEDKLVLEFLRNIKAEELVLVHKLHSEAILQGDYFAFKPCLEPYYSANAVISKPLEELTANAWGNHIPMIIGSTSFEGLVRYLQLKYKNLLKIYHKNPKLYFPPDIRANLTQERMEALLQQIKELYFKNTSEIMGFMEYDSFLTFWLDIHRAIKARQANNSRRTYQYLFDFDSPTFNHHRVIFCGQDIKRGVSHADDLSYLFYANYSWKLEKYSKEYLTIQRMIKMWTAFAKTSNPNCEYTKHSPWKSVEETGSHNWLRISNELMFEQMDENFEKKLNFLLDLYEQ